MEIFAKHHEAVAKTSADGLQQVDPARVFFLCFSTRFRVPDWCLLAWISLRFVETVESAREPPALLADGEEAKAWGAHLFSFWQCLCDQRIPKIIGTGWPISNDDVELLGTLGTTISVRPATCPLLRLLISNLNNQRQKATDSTLSVVDRGYERVLHKCGYPSVSISVKAYGKHPGINKRESSYCCGSFVVSCSMDKEDNVYFDNSLLTNVRVNRCNGIHHLNKTHSQIIQIQFLRKQVEQCKNTWNWTFLGGEGGFWGEQMGLRFGTSFRGSFDKALRYTDEHKRSTTWILTTEHNFLDFERTKVNLDNKRGLFSIR